MANLQIKQVYLWPLKMQAILFGIVLVVTFSLGFYFDVSSINTKRDTAKQNESDFKQQINSVIRKQVASKASIADFAKTKALLAQTKKQFVNYQDLPELLNTILKIGATNHLNFSLFTPGQESKEATYAKIPIQVVAVGTYHQIAEFLSEVANMPALVVIGNFIISTPEKASADAVKIAGVDTKTSLVAEMSLTVYYLPEVKT